jgi:hypothetical protein
MKTISLKETYGDDAKEIKAILVMFGTVENPATIIKTGRRK